LIIILNRIEITKRRKPFRVRATFIPQTRGENSLRLREYRSYLLLIVRYSPLFTLLRRERGEEGDGRGGGKKCGHARERRRLGAIEIIVVRGLMAGGRRVERPCSERIGSQCQGQSDIIKIIVTREREREREKGNAVPCPRSLSRLHAEGASLAPSRIYICGCLYLSECARARMRIVLAKQCNSGLSIARYRILGYRSIRGSLRDRSRLSLIDDVAK